MSKGLLCRGVWWTSEFESRCKGSPMLELFRSVTRVDVHIESMVSPFNVVSLGNLKGNLAIGDHFKFKWTPLETIRATFEWTLLASFIFRISQSICCFLSFPSVEFLLGELDIFIFFCLEVNSFCIMKLLVIWKPAPEYLFFFKILTNSRPCFLLSCSFFG